MDLVLATKNVHKIREYREMLRDHSHIEVISLRHYPDYEPPHEDGDTFEANAKIKAVDAARYLKKWVIADDSGLVVPAIGGEPGIISRRYSGEDATDRDNNNQLLKRMAGLKGIERSAYYACSICICGPSLEPVTVTGLCEGYLLETPRGSNGFGYDPLFVKHDHQKTFGEMTEETKNKLSHRRKALDKAIPIITRLLQ